MALCKQMCRPVGKPFNEPAARFESGIMQSLVERDYFTDYETLKDPYAFFNALRGVPDDIARRRFLRVGHVDLHDWKHTARRCWRNSLTGSTEKQRNHSEGGKAVSQKGSRKFAFFKAVEGGTVAVRTDNVTYVRTRVDGNGVFIAFPGDDGVGVEGPLERVVAALEGC
jgi:hypothetical protein